MDVKAAKRYTFSSNENVSIRRRKIILAANEAICIKLREKKYVLMRGTSKYKGYEYVYHSATRNAFACLMRSEVHLSKPRPCPILLPYRFTHEGRLDGNTWILRKSMERSSFACALNSLSLYGTV